MNQPPLTRVRTLIVELLHADLASLTRGRRALAYGAQLVREAVRELEDSSSLMRASALAFRTLLALVPLVVVLSGVAAGLFPSASDKMLDRAVGLLIPARDGDQDAPATGGPAASNVPHGDSQGDVLLSARASLRDQLEGVRTHAREINIIGFVLLLYTVLSLLESIEDSLNAVWHVRKGRGWLEKLPFYIALLFLAPIFLMASISLTTTFEAVSASAAETWLVPSWARGAPGFFFKHAVPVVLMTLALWVTYIWIPSAKIRRAPALLASSLAATGLEVLKQLFLVGAISVVRTNKIYGSLAVLPILFLWLYLSWVIILCGAAVAFVVQNFDDLTHKVERVRRGVEWRVYYALRIVLEAARRFRDGESPRLVADLVHTLDLPEYVVTGLCADLVEKKVLAAVSGDSEAYVPAKSLLTMTANDVVRAAGAPDLGMPTTAEDPAHRAVAELLLRLSSARESMGSTTLAALLDKVSRA